MSIYHKMKIKKNNKWNSIFQTQYAYFKYQVMSVNFFNALVSFMSYINKILIEKLDIFIIINLNDIFIYRNNFCQPYIDAI